VELNVGVSAVGHSYKFWDFELKNDRTHFLFRRNGKNTFVTLEMLFRKLDKIPAKVRRRQQQTPDILGSLCVALPAVEGYDELVDLKIREAIEVIFEALKSFFQKYCPNSTKKCLKNFMASFPPHILDLLNACQLSFRESARIQTFPDNYYFRGSWTESMCAQIGRCVKQRRCCPVR
jgi:site-specific DNA-cytosine methylase